MRNSSVGGFRILQGAFSKAAISAKSHWFSRLVILALLASLTAQAAEEPDTRYLRVYNLSEQADSFLTKGETNQAKAKYQQALDALIELKQDRPNWNTQVVTFRLNDLRSKLASFEPHAAPAPAPQTQPKPQARPQTSSSSGFKLLDAGAEPRKQLRLHPKVGDKQQTTITLKAAMEMPGAGTAQTQTPVASIILEMETVVTNVSDKGDITYAATIKDMKLADMAGTTSNAPPAIQAQAFDQVKGLTTIVTVSDRGVTKATAFQLPQGSDPNMKQAMDQAMKQASDQIKSFSGLSAGFPEEPVGKGARWQLAMPIKMQGINVTPTATFELVSLDGDRYTLKVTLAAQLANQRVQLSQQANGPRLDLTKASVNATGTVSSDLNHLLPSSGNLDAHVDVQAGMTFGNQRQAVNVKATIGVGLESK